MLWPYFDYFTDYVCFVHASVLKTTVFDATVIQVRDLELYNQFQSTNFYQVR